MTQVEISMTLRALGEELVDSAVKTKETYTKFLAVAKEEGLNEKQARELIIEICKKRQLSDRQTQRVLAANKLIDEERSAQTKAGMAKHKKEPDMMSGPAREMEGNEIYKGDAGNNPELVSKYVQEDPQPKGQLAPLKQETTTIVIDTSSWFAGIYSAKFPRGTMAKATYDPATGKLIEIERMSQSGSVRGEPL